MAFLYQCVHLGVVISRKGVTIDASLSSWVGMFEERAIKGWWNTHGSLHINELELLALHQSLKYFLPFLRASC